MHSLANTHFRPITLPKNASASLEDSRMNPERPEIAHGLSQSIRLLPKTYGTSIEPSLFSKDPIYALSEVFAFVSVSTAQYLDIIRAVLDDYTTTHDQKNTEKRIEIQDMLASSYNGLERRRHHITATLIFLKGHLERIGAEESTAILLLVRDYEYLLTINNELIARCDHEWNVIMSKASVEDARWTRDQAKSQYKFVFLATVYVPLSFSCSIFGMTFFELGSLKEGFTIWMGVTIPLFIISIIFLFWSPGYIEKSAKGIIKRFYRVGTTIPT